MPRSVAEIDSFITMLRVACEDQKINSQLERILSMPDSNRRSFIHTWISDLLIAKAPKDFIAAIACLADDQVAEKAYEVIFKCRRGDRL
ncbi:MAG: hypothetical protein A3I01_17155 [Betaproteobacteria bacterium RIFCSPLOWO2_02_FULL_65_24]|nr:MAG: hypothetical protein A3I01_17155 [Betaproteobacteria bacterium RIFCSPLOWO2_02_FULL_65_24]